MLQEPKVGIGCTNCCNIVTLMSALTPNSAGPAGPAGAPGTPGPDGSAGPPGALGSPGSTGRSGRPGRDGASGTNGTDGARGEDGAALGIVSWNQCAYQSLNSPLDYGLLAVSGVNQLITSTVDVLRVADAHQAILQGIDLLIYCYAGVHNPNPPARLKY